MLVITRRPNERIVFPSLEIAVNILKLTKGAVRIGIEAPPRIKVLREELLSGAEEPAKLSDHEFANALSKATLAIHLARKQLEFGRTNEADASLDLAITSLEALDQSQRQAAPEPRRCRALIVEDDANERELLAGLLGMSGCECDQAADGEDALAYLDAGGRPDVVLLDMAMPRCDGPQTLRRIRADVRYTGMKVFSVSGTAPRDLNIPEGPDGFDAWFLKPLNPSRLWDAIQESLHGPASIN